VDRIDPNHYNPNRQDEVEFAEFVAEVQRLGRLPKPIVVRPIGERYEIIDGEHGWRAAKAVGLTHVPCEVTDADDFEARMQTLKRNQHGTHSPVLEGLMFRDMLKLRDISIRKLAEEFHICEGTIRNRLHYAEAVDLRNRYAGTDSTKDVEWLSTRQVKLYVELPDEIRDKWLDGGASIRFFDRAKGPKLDYADCVGFNAAVEVGLADLIDPEDFNASADRILRVTAWRCDHRQLVDVDAYVRPVAELKFPVDFLDKLPCDVVGETLQAQLPADTWRNVLQDCQARAVDIKQCYSLFGSALRAALYDANLDPDEVGDPRLAKKLQTVLDGPEFIREANRLTLDEQCWLAEFSCNWDDATVLKAKQMTCRKIDLQRQMQEYEIPSEIDESSDVSSMMHECLQSLVRPGRMARTDELFADRSRLMESVMLTLQRAAADVGKIAQQPDTDLLLKRIAELAEPELHLLAGYVLDREPVAALLRWQAAIRKSQQVADPSSETVESASP
jgi:ParB/RepB/Spo0J family partition protein